MGGFLSSAPPLRRSRAALLCALTVSWTLVTFLRNEACESNFVCRRFLSFSRFLLARPCSLHGSVYSSIRLCFDSSQTCIWMYRVSAGTGLQFVGRRERR